jgi:cardiolipin synthase
MNTKPFLLLPADYIQDVTDHIKHAKTRVSFLTMVVDDDSKTDELFDTLIEAAARGVKVEVAADVFTYGELAGSFFPIQYYTKRSRQTTRMGKAFKSSGIRFTWFGRTHMSIFSGRMHIKWCIVDDTIYSFGGVNLYKAGLNNVDYMFKIEDPDLATKLIDEYYRLERADKGNYSYRSHDISYGDDSVLVDGGLIGDSIIYRRACKLAREATSVLLVSQYCPTGKLSKILKQTNSQLYFNPASNANWLNAFVINIGSFFTKNKTLYRKKQYLHAKFMIFDMPDGRRVALTGSHNFVNAGVLLGAREIALQTENPAVIKQLEDFWKNNIK